ncbi:MAG TPA: SpoIIE family protein phosphatase [Terriglobia bacterium]|nr:SpoIIE family protein phosphatase [Terriglobia bacterium]
MFKALVQEYRTRGWARFTAWLIILGIVLWVAEHGFGWSSQTLWFFFDLAAVVVVIYYLARLIGFIRRRMLWRLTRRLIVTYIFIAFVPIILILLLVGMGAFILNGQFAAYLVSRRMQEHVDELKQINRVVANEAAHIQSNDPRKVFDALRDFYQSDIRPYAANYPDLEITLRAAGPKRPDVRLPRSQRGDSEFILQLGGQERGFRLSGEPMKRPISEPRWLSGKEKEWSGFAINRGQITLAAVERETTSAGRLTLILSMPVTPDLLNLVGQGIGPVIVIPLVPPPNRDRAGRRPSNGRPSPPFRPPQHVEVYGESALAGYRVESSAVPLPAPRSWFDFRVRGASALNPVLWHAPQLTNSRDPVLVVSYSRIFPLNAQLLSILGRFSEFWVIAFVVVGVVFLSIEIVALAIGVLLTRSITSTVNRLQVATERVKSGDFSHRIGLPARDQVSALGAAFDTMTASIQRLMIESRERVRLENELKIAHEVQQQLFPQANPDIRGARVFGECRAARGVSGDFYDFLKLGRGRVGLVLGDVSGKGIYAALLMAGIQSAVRAQFYDGHFPERSGGAPATSTATVLDRLNRQIYDNTPDAKYATFFYAIYEAETRRLSYTNAGHPAPFLFRGNRLKRLDTGGTVLGLFPAALYQQEELQLEPGDLLLAFTDGLIEPENPYGEEFGDQRLAEVVREASDLPPERLAETVYREIGNWSGGAEPSDDMTLLYLKATL